MITAELFEGVFWSRSLNFRHFSNYDKKRKNTFTFEFLIFKKKIDFFKFVDQNTPLTNHNQALHKDLDPLSAPEVIDCTF